MPIIGISGYAKSGKDTAAHIIQQHDPSWRVKKFSHKLKQVASILTGYHISAFEDQEVKNSYLGGEWGKWSANSYNSGTSVHPQYHNNPTYTGMTVREFLQRLGTEAVRNNLHEDAWVNALFSEYENQKWIITDVRFPNEYNAIVERGGTMVRINRGLPVNLHPSETALDGYDFDIEIDNNGSLEHFVQIIKEKLL